jgi:hypothetical protein
MSFDLKHTLTQFREGMIREKLFFLAEHFATQNAPVFLLSPENHLWERWPVSKSDNLYLMLTSVNPKRCCLNMGSTAKYITIKYIQEIKGAE